MKIFLKKLPLLALILLLILFASACIKYYTTAGVPGNFDG